MLHAAHWTCILHCLPKEQTTENSTHHRKKNTNCHHILKSSADRVHSSRAITFTRLHLRHQQRHMMMHLSISARVQLRPSSSICPTTHACAAMHFIETSLRARATAREKCRSSFFSPVFFFGFRWHTGSEKPNLFIPPPPPTNHSWRAVIVCPLYWQKILIKIR